MRAKRVISLLPSATEMVCALGAGERLVGRSHECDFPAEIQALPACTAPKVDLRADSLEIDRQMQALKGASSLFHLDAEKMRQLQPDIILTQGQCEVCAVSEADVKQAVARWPGNHPQIISFSPSRFGDLWADLTRVADALELSNPDREVIRALKLRVVNIIERASPLKNRPTVVCVEWIEPLMAAGNWVPDMVDLAGGKNLLGEAGVHSPWTDWDTLLQLNPEVIVLLPCGFGLERTRAEAETLLRHPAWRKLRAARNHRVYYTDGSQYFNRPGPRLVDSLEILAEMFHPKLFDFGHKDKTWRELTAG